MVYMHRFFIVHSFSAFNRCYIGAAALFLAAKVEEQPQKLEYVARMFHSCTNRDLPDIDPTSEEFKKLMKNITDHEESILKTLGFDLTVEHSHPHVIKCTELVGASKDLSQTAYLLAHNSLLLTTFCLEHRPTVVACCCINLACVWKGIGIPPSQDQKKWWEYVDPSITQELLDASTKEFLDIYDKCDIYGKCPGRLQRKLNEVPQKQNNMKQEDAGSSSSGSQGDRGKVPTRHDHTPSVRHPSIGPPSNHPPPKTVNHHHRPHPPSDKPHLPLPQDVRSAKPPMPQDVRSGKPSKPAQELDENSVFISYCPESGIMHRKFNDQLRKFAEFIQNQGFTLHFEPNSQAEIRSYGGPVTWKEACIKRCKNIVVVCTPEYFKEDSKATMDTRIRRSVSKIEVDSRLLRQLAYNPDNTRLIPVVLDSHKPSKHQIPLWLLPMWTHSWPSRQRDLDLCLHDIPRYVLPKVDPSKKKVIRPIVINFPDAKRHKC